MGEGEGGRVTIGLELVVFLSFFLFHVFLERER